jgi:hypothetical protein
MRSLCFALPVCFQGGADALMPAELKAANPIDILLQIDGVLTLDSLTQKALGA